MSDFRSNNINSIVRSKVYNNIYLKIIYCLFPFLVSGALYNIVISEGLLTQFWIDYSNSISLLYIFLIAYFIGGYYPKYSYDIISSIEISHSRKKISKILRWIEILLVVVFSLVGPIFVYYSRQNESIFFWATRISDAGFIYYCIFLIFTWYLSASLAFSAIGSCFKINKILQNIENIKFDTMHPDNCFGLKKLSDLLIVNISLSLYYFFGAILIIITDQVSANIYGIKSMFYDIPQLSILVVIVVVFILIISILPLLKCRNIIENKKYILINENSKKIKEHSVDQTYRAVDEEEPNNTDKEYNEVKLNMLYKEREALLLIDETLLKSTLSKAAVLFSVIIPMIGIVIQLIKVV